MSGPAATPPPLYPIVNVASPGPAEAARALALAEDLVAAGATWLQLRAKPLAAGEMTTLARALLERLAGSAARLLVNDRADVAAACGAAGVHVGDEDLEPEAARRVLGAASPDAPVLVGYSTHSAAEAEAAAALDVDYLGFGPVYDSPTKAGVRRARGLEELARACRAARHPVVAIGGVTLEGAPDCWRAGAASVAVVREIETAADRRRLVADYRRAARACGLD